MQAFTIPPGTAGRDPLEQVGQVLAALAVPNSPRCRYLTDENAVLSQPDSTEKYWPMVPKFGIQRSEHSAMSKNTSFSLGEHFSNFVETQVEQGRYSSASDVVRAGLRLLEEQEAKLAVLRAALMEGEQSGASTPFDFEAFIARKRAAQSPPV